MMNTARPRIGSNIFDADPRADLKGPARKVLTVQKERAGENRLDESGSRRVERRGAELQPAFEDSGHAAESASMNPIATSTETKVRFGANVPAGLKERVDNAAYWVPGMTISKLVELALEKEIRRLEKDYNEGKPFADHGQFRFGRPRAGKE